MSGMVFSGKKVGCKCQVWCFQEERQDVVVRCGGSM